MLFTYSIISFSQVWSTSLLGVCFAFYLIHITFNVFNKSRNFFFQTILPCLKPFRPRGTVTNLKIKRFKGPYNSVHNNRLQEQRVQDVLNKNRNFSKFNENSICNQHQYRKIECFNKNDSENIETSKTSLNPNFMTH